MALPDHRTCKLWEKRNDSETTPEVRVGEGGRSSDLHQHQLPLSLSRIILDTLNIVNRTFETLRD